MELLSTLAWFFWDPNPDLFVIPYLNHPLRWYGLLFVSGFFAGFFILVPIVKRKLLDTKALLERDIASWPKFTECLRAAMNDPNHVLAPALAAIDRKTRQAIQKGETLTSETQKAILKGFTTSIQARDSQLDRQTIEKELPGAIMTVRDLSYSYVDRLTWFIVLGTILGARMGHVFFYEWPRYKNHLFDIVKVWEGGLASHGGTIGVIIAVILYVVWTKKEYPDISIISLCDMVAIPTALVGMCIRLGNFVNQEILGTSSDLPWAVVFGHPEDRSYPSPRHPVQLYEAAVYLGSFILLWVLWKRKSNKLASGFITGLFFVLIFGPRILLEFLKEPQSLMLDESILQTGQLLSIPFVLAGLFLLFYNTLSGFPSTFKQKNCL